MAYGTAAGVAALTPRYLNASAVFDTTTTPKLATVTAWLAEVSSLFDLALSEFRFVIPVTNATALSALGAQVNGYTAELARAINGHGAYGTAGGDLRPITEIYNDILTKFTEWLRSAADGLERAGADRDPLGAIEGAGIAHMRRMTVDEINAADGYPSTEYSTDGF